MQSQAFSAASYPTFSPIIRPLEHISHTTPHLLLPSLNPSLPPSPTLPLPQGRPMKKALATVSRLGLISPQDATAMQLLTERVSALKESLQVRERERERGCIEE